MGININQKMQSNISFASDQKLLSKKPRLSVQQMNFKMQVNKNPCIIEKHIRIRSNSLTDFRAKPVLKGQIGPIETKQSGRQSLGTGDQAVKQKIGRSCSFFIHSPFLNLQIQSPIRKSRSKLNNMGCKKARDKQTQQKTDIFLPKIKNLIKDRTPKKQDKANMLQGIRENQTKKIIQLNFDAFSHQRPQKCKSFQKTKSESLSHLKRKFNLKNLVNSARCKKFTAEQSQDCSGKNTVKLQIQLVASNQNQQKQNNQQKNRKKFYISNLKLDSELVASYFLTKKSYVLKLLDKHQKQKKPHLNNQKIYLPSLIGGQGKATNLVYMIIDNNLNIKKTTNCPPDQIIMKKLSLSPNNVAKYYKSEKSMSLPVSITNPQKQPKYLKQKINGWDYRNQTEQDQLYSES